MKTKRFCQNIFLICCLIITVSGLTALAKQKKESPLRFRSLNIPQGFDEVRADSLGRALDFQNWPQTEARYVAPVINKSMLSNPGLVTRSSISYSFVQFDQTPWGKCEWSWARLIEKDKPLPKELPPERKKELLRRIPEERRNDSEYISKYMKRKTERYIKSQRYRLEGELTVEVCLAPNSLAAQEYLLSTMTESSLPTESLISVYSTAKRLEDLGTLNFITESSKKDKINIKFLRDNLSLSIRANGCFAEEALPLARKINLMILNQPPLTYKKLLSRRPSVRIAVNEKDQLAVPFDISVPEGQQIVHVQALTDGQKTPVINRRISLTGKTGKLNVKLIALTPELLAGSSEEKINVNE